MRKRCLGMHCVATGSKSISLRFVSLFIPLEEQQIVGTGGGDDGTGWISGPRPKGKKERNVEQGEKDGIKASWSPHGHQPVAKGGLK